MNVPANNFYSRRKFLQTGGLALASAAVLAACGKNDKLAAGIPRLGEAPTTTGLPEGGATDIVLLRTATSLEYCAIDAYGAVADLNILPATSAAALKRFRDDHSAHAKALSELVKKVGGEPFECANEKINSLYISPAIDLILGNKDKGIDPSIVIGAIEDAYLAAARKVFKTEEDMRTRFNPETGQVELYAVKQITDEVTEPAKQISLSEAQQLYGEEAEAGMEIEFPKETEKLGRIAAQTAKQVMIQKFREEERNSLLEEFVKRQGELVTGTVEIACVEMATMKPSPIPDFLYSKLEALK
mgnify:CR=1 FL=1